MKKSTLWERKWKKKSKAGKVHRTQEKLKGNKPRMVEIRKEVSKSTFNRFKVKRVRGFSE